MFSMTVAAAGEGVSEGFRENRGAEEIMAQVGGYTGHLN